MKDDTTSRCRICDTPFVRKAPNQVLCGSADCKRINHSRVENQQRSSIPKQQHDKIACAHCGELFVPYHTNRQKYCSKDECRKARAASIGKRWREQNPDRARANARRQKREQRRADPEGSRTYERRYYAENRERIREAAREYRCVNAEAYRAYYNASNERRRKSGKWRADHAMAVAIRSSLVDRGSSKRGRAWESLLGYTREQLCEHLESLFLPGMTWDNYGEWHIDHITPQSWFTYTEATDPQFRECWSLANLQPLWAADNASKGARYAG